MQFDQKDIGTSNLEMIGFQMHFKLFHAMESTGEPEDSQFKFQTTAVTVQRLPNILRIWQEDQGKLIFSKEFARKTFLKFFSSRQCSNGVRARVLAWVLMCERQVKVT